MTRGFSRFAVVWLLLLLGSSISQAAAQAPAATPPATTYLLARLSAGTPLERYLQLARSSFGQLDINGDGRLTGVDDELQASMAAAQFRAAGVMQLLRADLNNDGAVTPDELRSLLRYEQRHNRTGTNSAAFNEAIDKRVEAMMKPDADGDGRVTLAEAAVAI